MNVHVLVDSCSDLSNTVRERMDISMIPLNIKLDRQLLDQLDITPQEYFARIDDFGLPETSSPNFAQWKEAYDNIFSRGFQRIVVITISSQLSNTYQQAVISSKKFYPGKIMVLDSHRASAGEGLIAIKFKQLLDKNYAVEEVNTFVEKNIPKVVEIGYMENLKMLVKSGRISKASEFIANLGQMKPMVHFNDGQLVPLCKVISLKNAKKRLFLELKERNNHDCSYSLNITHAADEETALEIKEEIEKFLDISQTFINYMGPVVGSRVGLNAQLVATFPDLEPE